MELAQSHGTGYLFICNQQSQNPVALNNNLPILIVLVAWLAGFSTGFSGFTHVAECSWSVG